MTLRPTRSGTEITFSSMNPTTRLAIEEELVRSLGFLTTVIDTKIKLTNDKCGRPYISLSILLILFSTTPLNFANLGVLNLHFGLLSAPLWSNSRNLPALLFVLCKVDNCSHVFNIAVI